MCSQCVLGPLQVFVHIFCPGRYVELKNLGVLLEGY